MLLVYSNDLNGRHSRGPEAAADPRAAADPKRRKSTSALLSAPKPNYSMRNVGDVF